MSAEPASITTYFRVCDGVRVRYADTKAKSDTTLLMLAPWPESLWAFRRISSSRLTCPALGTPTRHAQS